MENVYCGLKAGPQVVVPTPDGKPAALQPLKVVQAAPDLDGPAIVEPTDTNIRKTASKH